MNRTHLALGSLVLAASLGSGCENGPPGGGLTNGSPPNLTAEKPSMRTDMPERNRTNTGEANGAAGTRGSESAGTASNATGSPTSGSRSNGTSPTQDRAPRTGDDRTDTVEAVGSASAQPPSDKEGTAPGGAGGATKPPGDIKVGTPKSPQL